MNNDNNSLGYCAGDIISVYLDLDAQYVQFEKNGIFSASFNIPPKGKRNAWRIAASLSPGSQCTLVSDIK
jgi:hypothetical protein